MTTQVTEQRINWREACRLSLTPDQFNNIQYQNMLASAASLRPTPFHTVTITTMEPGANSDPWKSGYTYCDAWFMKCDGRNFIWNVHCQRFLELR